MTLESVDKDPDLRKSSDLEPINRSWVPWVLVILGGVIGIVLAVVAGLLGFTLFGWIAGENESETKAASAGAWASAVGATALALASVWLAVQANGQAREAEQRAKEEAALTARRHQDEIDAAEKRLQVQLDAAEAQNERDAEAAGERHREQMDTQKARYEADVARIAKESRDRQREEVRKREYNSAQAILVALGKFIADVYNHVRVIETSDGITKDIGNSKTMSDSDKTRYTVQMIIRNETSQMALLGTVNDCMMTVRTAMFQITSPELVVAVSSVFENMQEAAKCFTTADQDNDWEEAVRKTNDANEAGMKLQKKAAYRFFADDSEIPSELPIEYAIQPERRKSTDPAEKPSKP
ncbi:hypothetical protein CJ178_01755 [Rhodococcus sp. ACPA4]|uniref:hypothetical protein n=1 Tax=Rhodococcus sp. ACPA4 TaxID=2028571 RepID=UPI000BB1285F|nr:hypothetical protein [Rhodococcus sp. ACPA4]PBC40499.1 hypothetical protein CJ178_01755 [Rhodococcus sp. ACPA4]